MGNSISGAPGWFIERVRDVFRWPVNLIGDFPTRTGRLLGTLWRGLVGTLRSVPGAGQAIRKSQARLSARNTTGSVADWLHRFSTQIFDLIGGPEIAQFFTRMIGNSTPLSDEEIALISSVLGSDKIRIGNIRVAEGGLYNLIFKLNGNLAYSTWHTVHFPLHGRGDGTRHTRADLPILVHELTHVFQYETVGTRYLGEAIYMLIKTKRDCYNYGRAQGLRDAFAAGKQFREFNREQQAQISQDYFTLRQRGADVSAYEPFIAQLRAGEL